MANKLDKLYSDFLKNELGKAHMKLSIKTNSFKKLLTFQVASEKAIVSTSVTQKDLDDKKLASLDVKLSFSQFSKTLSPKDISLASASVVSAVKFYKDFKDGIVKSEDLDYYKAYFSKIAKRASL